MVNKIEDSEEITVYDLNELRDTEYPIRVVCAAINTVIEPIVDPEKLKEVALGVHEIVKDVEIHGSESYPKLIKIYRNIGGVSIETVNRSKEHSDHNGSGKLILREVFGDDYSATEDDGLYMGHLFIRNDNLQRFSEIESAA